MFQISSGLLINCHWLFLCTSSDFFQLFFAFLIRKNSIASAAVVNAEERLNLKALPCNNNHCKRCTLHAIIVQRSFCRLICILRWNDETPDQLDLTYHFAIRYAWRKRLISLDSTKAKYRNLHFEKSFGAWKWIH